MRRPQLTRPAWLRSPIAPVAVNRERLLRWRHWWALHLRWWRADLWLLSKRTVAEFFDDHGPQLAASISYYVFFSIFPLAILLVSIIGLLLTDDRIREEAIDGILDLLPLQSGAGREDLESLIDPIASGRSAAGVVSVLGLIWAATGMMSALRFGLDSVWDLEFRRPFVRGKLVDLGLVVGVGILITISIGATAVLQVGRDVSQSFADQLGPFSSEAGGVFAVLVWLLPFLMSWLTFSVVFTVVPSITVRIRDAIPGALVAALLFEVLKLGFSIYLRNFSNYDAIYGSLGAAIALLFFVYLGACVLIFGGEIAAEWPRVMHGHYDEDEELTDHSGDQPRDQARTPLRQRVGRLVARQFRHQQPIPRNLPSADARQARLDRRADERRRRLDDS